MFFHVLIHVYIIFCENQPDSTSNRRSCYKSYQTEAIRTNSASFTAFANKPALEGIIQPHLMSLTTWQSQKHPCGDTLPALAAATLHFRGLAAE